MWKVTDVWICKEGHGHKKIHFLKKKEKFFSANVKEDICFHSRFVL